MFGGGVLLKGCLGVLLAVLCAPVAVSYALAVMQGQAVNAPWCCATDARPRALTKQQCLLQTAK